MKLPAYRSRAEQFSELARECGFDLSGIAAAGEIPAYRFYQDWVREGMAGQMKYLTDRRAAMRESVRHLLPAARSVLCVGKVYRTPDPGTRAGEGRVSCYAWGRDYHEWMRARLEDLLGLLHKAWGDFDSKICVDTAPVLERAAGRSAGLGWIGRNTCLINEGTGSWFFLGEILTTVELPPGTPPPDRCGTCTRCVDACPTGALVESPGGSGSRSHKLDSRKCISYLTIELRGEIPAELRPAMGDHLFGCDICQDVCPWNTKSPQSDEAAFQPRHAAVNLQESAGLTPEAFRERYRDSPVWRVKHQGFLRNVAVAMGNSGDERYVEALRTLAACGDPVVSEHAEWALSRLFCSAR